MKLHIGEVYHLEWVGSEGGSKELHSRIVILLGALSMRADVAGHEESRNAQGIQNEAPSVVPCVLDHLDVQIPMVPRVALEMNLGKEEKELLMLPPKPVAEEVEQRGEVSVEIIDDVMTVRVLGIEDDTAPCFHLRQFRLTMRPLPTLGAVHGEAGDDLIYILPPTVGRLVRRIFSVGKGSIWIKAGPARPYPAEIQLLVESMLLVVDAALLGWRFVCVIFA